MSAPGNWDAFGRTRVLSVVFLSVVVKAPNNFAARNIQESFQKSQTVTKNEKIRIARTLRSPHVYLIDD
jgi:hypothetical protein